MFRGYVCFWGMNCKYFSPHNPNSFQPTSPYQQPLPTHGHFRGTVPAFDYCGAQGGSWLLRIDAWLFSCDSVDKDVHRLYNVLVKFPRTFKYTAVCIASRIKTVICFENRIHWWLACWHVKIGNLKHQYHPAVQRPALLTGLSGILWSCARFNYDPGEEQVDSACGSGIALGNVSPTLVCELQIMYWIFTVPTWLA